MLDRLQLVLDSFAANLDTKANAGTSELFANAAKQFGHTIQHHRWPGMRGTGGPPGDLTAQPVKNHTDLANKVQEFVRGAEDSGCESLAYKCDPNQECVIRGGTTS